MEVTALPIRRNMSDTGIGLLPLVRVSDVIKQLLFRYYQAEREINPQRQPVETALPTDTEPSRPSYECCPGVSLP